MKDCNFHDFPEQCVNDIDRPKTCEREYCLAVKDCSTSDFLPSSVKSQNVPNFLRDDESVEHDLTDEGDDYEEPSVQKYLPGVNIEVRLRPTHKECNGKKVTLPMIVDFYSECLKTYGEEKNFTYEESYLKDTEKNDAIYHEYKSRIARFSTDNTRTNAEEIRGSEQFVTFSQNPTDISLHGPNENASVSSNDLQRQNAPPGDIVLDDVMWLKNRPNDPLLRCIRSITDRLNIQGIVGDPTSYLKEGGDDMHYDIDDPFIDDSAMFIELKTNRNDILLKKEMERDFSVWSEEDQEADIQELQPASFFAHYASSLERDILNEVNKQKHYKLFFYPSGWRKYIAKVPKQFHSIFVELENNYKNTTDYVTDEVLRKNVTEIIETIFNRLTKFQEHRVKNYSKTPMGRGKMAEGNSPIKVKNSVDSIFERRGLDCIFLGKILGVNGRILRWIVKSITSITNVISPFEIHKIWLIKVLKHNEKILTAHAEKIGAKLASKLKVIKERKGNTFFVNFCESIKKLSKNIGIIRKMLKEHKENSLSTGVSTTKADVRRNSTAVRGTETVEKSDANQAIHTANLDSDMKEESVDAVDDLISKEFPEKKHSNDKDGVEINKPTGIPIQKVKAEKDDCFSSMLKQSKIWKRMKDVVGVFRLVGNDVLTFVQMVNLSTAVSVTIADTDFGSVIQEKMLQQPVFDHTYIYLGSIVTTQICNLSEINVNVPVDVSRAAVLYLQQMLKVDDLHERKNRRSLVFFDNSCVCAASGKVLINAKKQIKRKTSPTKTSMGNTTKTEKAKKRQKNSK